MFIIKEITHKDFLPSRESFTKENTLMVCDDFGFIYLFFEEITPENTGNIEIIFDILYKDIYKLPEVLIPTKEYKDLFIEFKEKCFVSIDPESFFVLKKDDFMLVDQNNGEQVKLRLPAGSLVFKSKTDRHTKLEVIDTLKTFWKGDIIRQGKSVWYSKNKKEVVEKC